MSHRRQRPSAFEVSFPAEASALHAAPQNSRSSSIASMGSLKRKNEEEPQAPRLRPLPPVAYYDPSSLERDVEVHKETDELALSGEDPDDDGEGFGDGGDMEERKPIRVLSHFTIFDPKHKNEMIPLDILETDDGKGREVVVVGFAQTHFEERDWEDEGQEEDLEGDEPLFLELSAILRYTINYSQWNDPVYIETQWAWYILDMPSGLYAPYHQYFLSPKRVAQMVISTALNHPTRTLERFLDEFTDNVDPFGHTYVTQDLWDSVPEIYEILQGHRRAIDLTATTLIRSVLGEFRSAVPKRKRQDPSLNTPRFNQIPANRLIGSIDRSVANPKNQNPTHVTPRIAALAIGLAPETLRVVGKPLPQPNKTEVERNKAKQQRRVHDLLNVARKARKDIRWEKSDRLSPGSQYLKRVVVEGETYNVGDTILVPNGYNTFWKSPGQYNERLDIPLQATIADFFWFGKIQSLCHDTGLVHFQWFEHGSGIFLQELCDEQQLFLINVCGTEKINAIVGKVEVRWNVPPGKSIYFHEFSCNFMYDGTTGTFSDINPDDLTISNVVRPPDNCPVCILDEQRTIEAACLKTNDGQGVENGFTHLAQKYHYGDFVSYYAEAGPAHIGFITKFKINTQRTSDLNDLGFVTCRKVGRIMNLGDVLPQNVLRDERHLFMTDETAKVKIKDLLGVIFVPCTSSLQGQVTLEEWVAMAPNHFFIKYRFQTCHPTNWNQRERVVWDEHDVCTPCWEEKISEIKARKATSKEYQKRPLKTLDLFGGVGAFSQSLAQGSGALVITHAIELESSAAKTFKRNSPHTIVYNQCSNAILHYTIKSWEGHDVKTPYQLYDENIPVPPPPAKDDIKVIVAGFPCQAYSALNRSKNVNDVRYNLFLNALSWVDAVRPQFAIFENVPGFLSHRLKATQVSMHKVEGGIEMGGFKFLVRALLDMRYQVRFALLQAAHYGTPQGRIRFFLTAAQSGHPLPELPQPSHHFDGTALEIKVPYGIHKKEAIGPIRVAKGTALHPTISIDDAISDLPRFDWKHPFRPLPARYEEGKRVPTMECNRLKSKPLDCGFRGAPPYYHEPKTRFQQEVRSKPTRNLQHFTKLFDAKRVGRVIAIPLRAKADYRSLAPRNQEWQLANAQSYIARNNYKSGVYGRLDKNGVFQTIITNVDPTSKQSWVLNPYCRRIVTVRELARAQGFPDSFVFESINNSVVTMHRQIGNAVPFPLGRAIGRQLRISLLKKWVSAQQNAIEIDDDDEDGDVVMGDDDDHRSDTMATNSPEFPVLYS